MATSVTGLDVGLVIIGGYTEELHGRAVGISTLVRAQSAGDEVTFEALTPTMIPSPSYLILHPSQPWLFAVSETKAARVTSYLIHNDGSLSAIGSAESGGDAPCHLCIAPTGHHLVVTNYSGGSVCSLAIRSDGSLSERLDLFELHGSGPDPERQESPHAHQAVPDGAEVLVCDLGTDQIHRLTIDHDGEISTAAEPVRLPPGSGPRHLVLLGNYLVVACELSAQVVLFNRVQGAWKQVQILPSSTAKVPVRIFPSAIVSDGDRVYVANRGAGTVAAFDLDRERSELSLVAEFATGGPWPRDLTLSPGHLWVANETKDRVSVFNTTSLPPSQVEFEIRSPSPACIVLLDDEGAAIP